MEDILENKLICRICLKVVDQTKQSYGNIEDETGTLRDMMLCCIPEMDIYVSSNPILCFPCIQALVGLYNFKTKCINTETIIKTYMHRHNISEFGNVNLTCVVKDLIKINTIQKQMQDQRVIMAQQSNAIATTQPNRTMKPVDNISNTLSEYSPQKEQTISTLEDISTNHVSQVSQEVSEENDSYPAKDAVVKINSDVLEVPSDETFEKTIVDIHLPSWSSEINSKLLNSKSCILPPVTTLPIITQSPQNQSAKTAIPCFDEKSVQDSENPCQALKTPELNSKLSKVNTENTEFTEEESLSFFPQARKQNTELHRPFFDNLISLNINTTCSNISKPNLEMLQTYSYMPSCTTPQNPTDHLALKSNSPILRSSSTTLTKSDNSMSDQKEFEHFSPQYEQDNHQTGNSPPELKNLDSEISQIIDQLDNDLDKEGSSIFLHVGNKPQESQASQASHISQENLHCSLNHHNQTNQFPETLRHLKYSSHMSNRPLPQIEYHATQLAQSSSRIHHSSADLRQFPTQIELNASHLLQNSSQVDHSCSQMGINSNHMGMNSHIAMNRSEVGQISQQLSQIGAHSSQIGGHSSQMGTYSSQMGAHSSQMRTHSSQMGPHPSQMGQHLSQLGQHSYQIRPHLSQMSHSSQRSNSGEMDYQSQIVHHPSHISTHYSQLSSQFPNISNHLRNGPQMSYVSSNMANALAQVGQVPSDYNQMSPQMKYLRMQLQIRQGLSPVGSIPPQVGNRPILLEGRPNQLRHWLPPPGHDSAQRRFNSSHGKMTHDTPHYRLPQLPYHMGYGHSQLSQGSSALGQLSQHMNQQNTQVNHGNSQFSHPQNSPQPPHFSQMHYYPNRSQKHFNRCSPSQSPSLSEMHQRSIQQTPTPPSRSPQHFLHSQNRSGMFSPNFDSSASSEMVPSNNEFKKSDSPLSNCKSPDAARYVERDNWKINHCNFRASNSTLSRFVPTPINSQIRMPSQDIPILPPHFGDVSFKHMAMPPPQTNVLPKDHLAQRLKLNSGTSRVESSQSDNYHSTSDESINSLLVDLPPIETPVVPLNVQIKSLGTLESIQQPIKESQDLSEMSSSVNGNVSGGNKDIIASEVQNGSESVGMKNIPSSDERKNKDNLDAETSESKVATINKEASYKEISEENSVKKNSEQDESSRQSSTEKMDIEPIVLVNHPNANKLSQEPVSNKIFSMNYQCFNCTFVTNSSEDFIRHRETCKEVKEKVEHKCPHCPYVTTRRYVLTQHVNSQHTKEIWYQCLDCDYKCTDKSYLKKHSKIHVEGSELEEKVCEYCDFRTLSEYNYRKHLSKHDIQVLQCEFCSYSTNDRTNFRRHLFTHNPVSSDCDFCDYKSVSPYHMRNHLKKYHNGVGIEDLDLRKDQPIMELVDQIRAAVKDANQISLGLYKV